MLVHNSFTSTMPLHQKGTFNAKICNDDDVSNNMRRRSSHRETRCRNEVLFQRETIVKRPRKNADGFIGKKITVFKEEMNIIDVARQIASYKSQRDEEDAFYVMSVNKLVTRFMEWKRYLPRIEPFYAVKCNDDPVVLKVLTKLGCGLDVASKAEFVQAVKLVSTEKIVYANPVKTKSFIKRAKEVGISMMTFDSVDELNKVAILHPQARMILRIATDDSKARCPLSMKFGCEPITDGAKLLKIAAELGIHVVGISFHVGSDRNDPAAFYEPINHARTLFDIGLKLGHKMSVLDVGGGFPGIDNVSPTFANIADIVSSYIDKCFPADENVRIIAEPGRFFATAPFSLVTNIIGVKRVPAERISKNGTTHHDGFMYYMNEGIYGSFNCIYFDFAKPEGKPLFDKEDKEYAPCSIWGPTCDGFDQVEKRRIMPRLSIGDWLYYDNMGAYTRSAASMFNGFEKTRTYYFTDKNTWKLIADAT